MICLWDGIVTLSNGALESDRAQLVQIDRFLLLPMLAELFTAGDMVLLYSSCQHSSCSTDAYAQELNYKPAALEEGGRIWPKSPSHKAADCIKFQCGR